MRQPPILCGLLALAFCAHARPSDSQTDSSDAQTAAAYHLSVAVDEVILTFHAADARGLPVNDLKPGELGLLDNGKPPQKILAFDSVQDVPLRAGILMDISESMDQTRSTSRAIALQYARQLLRRQTDQAFVINFDRRPTLAQTWTTSPYALADGIRNLNVKTNGRPRNGGTAVFDAVYHACHDQFAQFASIDHAASGNFILLFSDGEDNASDTDLKTAVDICQRTNTAIFAFRSEAHPGLSATGPAILAALTSQTGGRVFRDDDSAAEIDADLRTIEADLRNQYRLIYKPADVRRDGSFHRIQLTPPPRVDTVTIRSGYYAPAH